MDCHWKEWLNCIEKFYLVNVKVDVVQHKDDITQIMPL